jgi:hypothetical protein
VTIELERSRPGASERLFRSIRFRLALIVAIATVLLSIQSVAARSPSLRFDVATLVVVFLAMDQELIAGLVLTLVVSYVADVLSGEPRGLYVASLVIVYSLVRLIVFRVVGSTWVIVTGIGIVATAIALGVRLVFRATLGDQDFGLALSRPSLPSTFIFAILFSHPIYLLLRAIEGEKKSFEGRIAGGRRSAQAETDPVRRGEQ